MEWNNIRPIFSRPGGWYLCWCPWQTLGFRQHKRFKESPMHDFLEGPESPICHTESWQVSLVTEVFFYNLSLCHWNQNVNPTGWFLSSARFIEKHSERIRRVIIWGDILNLAEETEQDLEADKRPESFSLQMSQHLVAWSKVCEEVSKRQPKHVYSII